MYYVTFAIVINLAGIIFEFSGTRPDWSNVVICTIGHVTLNNQSEDSPKNPEMRRNRKIQK